MTQIDPTLDRLLNHMVTIGASDLYVTADSPPVFRVNGEGHAARVPLKSEEVQRLADSVMNHSQREEFGRTLEMNLGLALNDVGRFRVNIFRQRGATGMVVRLIRTRIKTLDELRHPEILKKVALSKRGLVLLAGGTGSGKSTTLAAIIDHRNSTETGHIITIEDPVEFVHPHKKCVVTQREVGVDTVSYSQALKNTLRQAPDMILIGEIRDTETMEAAVSIAESGHLCLATLHANNANQAIQRILNFFPPSRHQDIKMQLALNVRAIVSQRLVPAIGGDRAAALEILLDTPRIKDLIKRGEIDTLKDAMEQGVMEGCQTFDTALAALCAAGRISTQDALLAADSPNNLSIRLERLGNASQAGAKAGEPRLRLLSNESPRPADKTPSASSAKLPPTRTGQ